MQDYFFTPVSADDPQTAHLACYYFEGKEDAFFFIRPGTYDTKIFEDVALRNEYGLPESFRQGDVVIDIGAHIGSFAYAALTRGAPEVHSYETHPDNYSVAIRNLARFGDRAVCHHLGVWRSDTSGATLFTEELDSSANPNTGGFSVVYNDAGIPVETVGLDEILFELSSGLKRRVRFLKIDCEGAEYPILFTSKYLGRIVEEISGEYHEIPPHMVPPRAKVKGFGEYNRHRLRRFLEREGFFVDVVPTSSTGGLFHAYRKSLRTSLARVRRQTRALLHEWRVRSVSASRTAADVPAQEPGDGELVATESDVYFCYRLLLGREPDSSGWRHWTLHIKRNKSLPDLINTFMDSEEYRKKWDGK